MTGVPMGDQLAQVAKKIEAGQYEAAAADVKGRLRSYAAADLPLALMLRGKALLAAYDKSDSKDRHSGLHGQEL